MTNCWIGPVAMAGSGLWRSHVWRRYFAFALMLSWSPSGAVQGNEPILHEKAFRSPVFELGPGDVTNSYHDLEFPQGHIAIRSLVGEVVDENDAPVPLTDVYLHHWTVSSVRVQKGRKQLASSVARTLDVPTRHNDRFADQEGGAALNATPQGTCEEDQGSLHFGFGSETRHLNTTVPAPYGFVTGDSDASPEGYEEAWVLNVHAISTIGAADASKCFECLCESYGVTRDENGNLLPEEYIGGLHCCYDKMHCVVKEGVQSETKKYYLKYTLTWVDWDETVVPLRTYRFDVTDPRTSLSEKPDCKLEYTIPQCSPGTARNQCVDHRHSIGAISVGGDLVMGRLHQHTGGLGGILYYKDGHLLCSADPIYGQGTEAGDEAGYLVGMTTCHPEPGTVKVEGMKELHFDAYYSNEHQHTGVMSYFVMHVADPVKRIQEVTDDIAN